MILCPTIQGENNTGIRVHTCWGFTSGWKLFLMILAGLFSGGLYAQNTPFPPPREIRIYAAQDLNFGSFYPGVTGGTVAISPSGLRTPTGTVVLAGGAPQPAIFIVELLPGRLVSIMAGPQVTLNRIGGGGSMTMTTGPTDKGTSFVTSSGHPFFNPVQVGATLNIGNISQNPAGSYVGSFSITFIQE